MSQSTDHEYKLVRARFLIPMSRDTNLSERIADGYVLVKGSRILQVGAYSKDIGKVILSKFGHGLQVLGCKENPPLTEEDVPCIDGVIMPGFVKAHGHDHETAMIGVAKDRPLTAWLDEAVNLFGAFLNERSKDLESILKKSPYLVSYLKARIDDLSYGITSALTHHCNFNKYHVAELVEANRLAGTSITIAVGSQDRHYDQRVLDIPNSKAIERLNSYYDAFSMSERVRIIPGPDQEFSNSPELLRASKAWAREHESLIHIHTSEEPGTTRWFTQTYGTTPIEYLDSVGFLDERTILAHVVNITQKELEIIKERGSKVVHNPLANTILGSGMPPIPKMLELGIPVAIATDGSGSSDNQNILNAARVAAQYQKAYTRDAKQLPAKEVLEMITARPAEILGLNAGRLEEGRNADMVVVDLSRPNLVPTRLDNVLENLVWAANGSEIRDVIANGRILIEEYQIRIPNTGTILSDLQQLSEMFIAHKNRTKVARETGMVQ